MKICYYDIIAPMGIHANFNAGLINVLYNWQNNTATIDLYSERIHGIIVSDILKKEKININLKPFKILNKKIIGGWKTLLRDILGIRYVITAFINKKKKDILVFGLAYPICLHMIFLCSLLLKKNVLVCLHGELSLFVKNNKYFRNKMYFSLEKNITMKKNNYLRCLVLGEPIYEVTKHIFNRTPIIINHPYVFNYKKLLLIDNFKPIIVGQIGGGSKEKGTQYLFYIARAMKKEIERNEIKFVLVGRLDKNLLSLDEGLIEYQNEVIEQTKFESAINDLHFTLQLRDDTVSQATASASFLDSLKYNKPFFSLNNNYIVYYLKQTALQDYIFNTIDDIIERLRWFIAMNKEKREKEYYNMVHSIQQLKKMFSIQYNAELLSSQLDNI
jgi:hypothetical protein